MSRFDRYITAQLLALFGFFSLVLVAVYWINRAVGLFDQLIGDGETVLVFIELSLLTLPNAIRAVLPIAAFVACLYAVNRLMQDSELVIMRATGFSAWRLARPVLFFGLSVLAMQLVLTNVLVPASQSRLTARTAEISRNVTARFLTEGRFTHPAPGLAIYTREITALGELEDLFMVDSRLPEETDTYTARRALIIQDDTAPRLLMLDGMVQQRSGPLGARRLAVTRFGDFTLDLSRVVARGTAGRRNPSELATPDLLRASLATQEETGASAATLLEEGHSRLAGPLMGLAAPLIGFAALMLGTFSRLGLWRQMTLAVILIIAVQALNTVAAARALRSASAWPLVYAGPLVGLIVAGALLALAERPRRLPRQEGAA